MTPAEAELLHKIDGQAKQIADLTAKLKAAEEIIERADKNQNQ